MCSIGSSPSLTALLMTCSVSGQYRSAYPKSIFCDKTAFPTAFTLALEPGAALAADPLQLPLASQSVDLVVLPHVLEGHPNPHDVLREVERVLMPEGQVVISGFNTASLWRVRQLLRAAATTARPGTASSSACCGCANGCGCSASS